MTHLQVLDYNGGRTLDALIKYVEKRVDGTATDDDGGEEEEPAEGEDEVPEEDQGEDGAGQEEEKPSSTDHTA